MFTITTPAAIRAYKGAYFKKDKSVFAIYIFLGSVTLFGSVYATYKAATYIGIGIPAYAFVLLFVYILMQTIFAYGLFWTRRWLLPLISLMMIVDVLVFSALYGGSYSAHALAAGKQLLLLSIPWLFLYLTRKKLTGNTWEIAPIFLYTIAFTIALAYNLQYILVELI